LKEVLKQDRLAHSAYHEAGHAVTYCLLGIPFSHTTIAPPEEAGCSGITVTIPKDDLSRQEICDEMVVLASGIMAVTFMPGWNPGLHDFYPVAGADDDLEQIRKYAGHLTTDEKEYIDLVDQAHELLGTPTHRAAVKRVAEALLEKKTLEYKQVQQIVDQVLQDTDQA
jgi:ATP-dependent Zn protease